MMPAGPEFFVATAFRAACKDFLNPDSAQSTNHSLPKQLASVIVDAAVGAGSVQNIGQKRLAVRPSRRGTLASKTSTCPAS